MAHDFMGREPLTLEVKPRQGVAARRRGAAGPVDVGNVTCDGRGSDCGTHVRTVAAAPRLGPRRRPDVRYTRSFSTRRGARKCRRDAGAAADEFRPR